MTYTSKSAALLRQVIQRRNLQPMTDEQWAEIAPPRPPYPADELETDSPLNQRLLEGDRK